MEGLPPLAALSFLILLVFLLSNFSPNPLSPSCRPPPPATLQFNRSDSASIQNDTDPGGLPAALRRASEGNNKTVIIAVINKAYVERTEAGQPLDMLDLFLESFWLGEGTRPLVNHLLIVAADRTAYERCLFRGLHCQLLEAESDGAPNSPAAGEQVYMSKGFIDLMWRRTLFLLTVLREGYSFIFTDTDVVWLRNPFTRLDDASSDIEFSTDWFNGHPSSEKNQINTGFYRVRSSNRTIALFERWYGLRHESAGMKEQDVLQGMVRRGAVGELGLAVRFLDTIHFSGFCQDSKDFREVVTVHANCCRYISAKVNDLAAVLADWNRFKRMTVSPTAGNGTAALAWSPHVHCRKSWEH